MDGFVTFGGVMSALGLASVLKQAYYLHFALRSNQWPTAKGRIVSASWGPMTVTPARHGLAGTVVNLRYSYDVGGQPLEGYLVSYKGVVAGLRSTARQVARRYPEGTHVLVHYDPRHPSRAVLEPGPGVSSFVRVGLGAAMFGVGLWALGHSLGAT
jgi:hypothetical protein